MSDVDMPEETLAMWEPLMPLRAWHKLFPDLSVRVETSGIALEFSGGGLGIQGPTQAHRGWVKLQCQRLLLALNTQFSLPRVSFSK